MSDPHDVLVAAGVLVRDRATGAVLLQLRGDDATWGLPGGRLEPGESLEQAARRELLEETGLAAGDLALVDVYSGPEFVVRYPMGTPPTSSARPSRPVTSPGPSPPTMPENPQLSPGTKSTSSPLRSTPTTACYCGGWASVSDAHKPSRLRLHSSMVSAAPASVRTDRVPANERLTTTSPDRECAGQGMLPIAASGSSSATRKASRRRPSSTVVTSPWEVRHLTRRLGEPEVGLSGCAMGCRRRWGAR